MNLATARFAESLGKKLRTVDEESMRSLWLAALALLNGVVFWLLSGLGVVLSIKELFS